MVDAPVQSEGEGLTCGAERDSVERVGPSRIEALACGSNVEERV
jgi:hypothetical protein